MRYPHSQPLPRCLAPSATSPPLFLPLNQKKTMLHHFQTPAFIFSTPLRPPSHTFHRPILTPIVRPYILTGPRRPQFYASISANSLANSEPLQTSSKSLPKPPTNHIIRFLRLLFSNFAVVPALCAAVIGSICSVMQPFLYGRIVGLLSRADLAPFPGMRRELFKRVATLGCLFLMEITVTTIYIILVTRLIDKVTRKLREMVFAKTLVNDVGFFDDTGRANIESGLSNQITEVRDGVWRNLSRDRGIRAIFDVAFGLAFNISNTGSFGAPIFAILVPIMATIVAQLGLRNGRMVAKMGKIDSGIRTFLNEKLRGVRTLKAFGAEQRERFALSNLLDNAGVSADQVSSSKAMSEAGSRSSVYITILIFFVSGGLLICAGGLSYEDFSCLVGFIWIMNFAIQGVSYTITDATKVTSALKDIYALHDRAEAYRSTFNKVINSNESPEFVGHVRFNDVCFHYPSRPDVLVLKNINFSIRPGEMIALTGGSGEGKSTVASMLCRFYSPSSGSVTLDGIDIQSLPTEIFAKQISLVDQDPILFEGSIRENIAYGLPDEDASDEQVIKAAKEANAHDFIMKLAKGYDTKWSISSNFSGGQRQRIAIARSLIKSPRILVLDEATSALDQESERMVQNALERVMKNRTVLIIAHRLSTVRNADVILFVKNGRIAERGTYDELYANPTGHFRALVESATEVRNQSTPKI